MSRSGSWWLLAAERVSKVAAEASALSLCRRHCPSAPLVLQSSGPGHCCPTQLWGVLSVLGLGADRQTFRAEAVTC
jgi:hypothetical protein